MSNRAKSKDRETNADKLRELLNDSFNQINSQKAESHQFRLRTDDVPQMDDLVRLIQTVESVNQQLLFENKYLKDEMTKSKANILKLIEENTYLHKELKNITVIEILNEFQNKEFTSPQDLGNSQNDTLQNQLKNKHEELQQSQLLINELQKKLASELNRNTKSKRFSGSGKIEGTNTLDNLDSFPICCTKCSEELELRLKQIENLKDDLEQATKSKSFLRTKLDEFELRESELLAQVKKYTDLVTHLEMERDEANIKRDQYLEDKINSEKKLESIIMEYNQKVVEEKGSILNNFEAQIKTLTDQNQELEKNIFKQENLIDRLTRDKISLISEVESYKKKCNSIDFDTHQMSEKLRNKYLDALKERDLALHELKRLRHDNDLYIKENDQDKFCLRNELNTTRSRLLDVEKDLLNSREQCIQLTEEINKLQAEALLLKHSKESVEISRKDNLDDLTKKYEKRETQLIAGIEALQARYCVTVKELEDLIEMQKKLLNNLKTECKTLNEQLQILAAKYKNDVTYLNNQCEEMSIRQEKLEKHIKDIEEQNERHSEMHDKMKARLKEVTLKLHDQRENLKNTQSNETNLKSANIQLLHEISAIKQQLSMFTAPTRFQPEKLTSRTNANNSIADAEILNSVRSLIGNNNW